MTVAYFHLTYEDYKHLEQQMRQFAETVHTTTPGPFYHKSIRLAVNENFIVEFHGPHVRGAGRNAAQGTLPLGVAVEADTDALLTGDWS